jgi:hypothetical protein
MSFSVIWRNTGLTAFDPMLGDYVQPSPNVEDGLTAREALTRARKLHRCGHVPVIIGSEGRQRNRALLQLAVWLEPIITQFRTQ